MLLKWIAETLVAFFAYEMPNCTDSRVIYEKLVAADPVESEELLDRLYGILMVSQSKLSGVRRRLAKRGQQCRFQWNAIGGAGDAQCQSISGRLCLV
jgi:hypothetical protein